MSSYLTKLSFFAIVGVGLLFTSNMLSGQSATHLKNGKPNHFSNINPSDNAARQSSAVNTNNDFGLKLLKQIQQTDKNTCISPYSIQNAFGMMSLGAQGQTLTEMKSALAYPENVNFYAGMKAYRDKLTNISSDKKSPIVLAVANGLFIDKTSPVKDAFIAECKNYFQASTELVDFKSNSDGERRKINRWVEQQTNERIKDLLPLDSIDRDTSLVLANALYFKAPWTVAFDPRATTSDNFTNANRKQRKVSYMNMSQKLHYFANKNYSAISIPFGTASKMRFTVILPNKSHNVDKLLETLSSSDLITITKAPKAKVALSLPKFKHEGASTRLRPALESMGMKIPFSQQADFSKMSDESLLIDEAFHKVFLEIDEEGGEAAAATAVVVKPVYLYIPVTLKVDRPFIYAIQDSETGLCLFMGTVKTL